MYPDTEEAHKRDCLARHVCTIGSLEQRREFIAALRLRHGEIYAKDIQGRVEIEWEKRRSAMHAKSNPHAAYQDMDLLRPESRQGEVDQQGPSQGGEAKGEGET